MSTDEIRVIPPFLAAVLILASASKNKTPRYPVAFAVPTLLPTAYPVAFTGNVREQDEAMNNAKNVIATNLIFWVDLNMYVELKVSPTHKVFRLHPCFSVQDS